MNEFIHNAVLPTPMSNSGITNPKNLTSIQGKVRLNSTFKNWYYHHREKIQPFPLLEASDMSRVQSGLTNETKPTGMPNSDINDITQQNSANKIQTKVKSVFIQYYKNTVKINTFPFKCTICEPQLCRGLPGALVLVNSRPQAFEQRQAIRDTWGLEVREGRCYGRSLSEHVAVGFVIGLQNNTTVQTKIELESNVYHDIIQGDFIDHYTNLTFKSLLAMNWTAKYCSKAKYFIKSDDDMVINFPHLLQFLNRGKFNKSIVGPVFERNQVFRHGAWKVSLKEFPLQFYPPYVGGSAYVITMDILRSLLEASQYYPYFAIDDAYITGILAKRVRAMHVRKYGFAYSYTRKPNPCDFLRDNCFTGHNFTASDMRIFWEVLTNGTCKTNRL